MTYAGSPGSPVLGTQILWDGGEPDSVAARDHQDDEDTPRKTIAFDGDDAGPVSSQPSHYQVPDRALVCGH